MASQLVLLGSHPVCHTVSAGTDSEYMKSGVSAFLRWKSFERLSEMGYKGNDMTDAALNPVTHFKSQFGGDLHLNLVLTKPDRGGFLLESMGLQAGSAAKRGVRRMLARVRPSQAGSDK
jgi:hypothetical protein